MVAAAVGVVLVGAALVLGMRGGPEPAAAAQGVPVLVRQVGALNRSDVVVVSGDVDASRSGSVAFQVPGRIVAVWVQEGQVVQAGAPLAQLDTTEYQLQLAMASSAARQADDQYRRLQQMREQNGVTPADFVKMESAHRQAQAQLALVQKHLADTRLVAPIGGVIARRGIEVGEQVAPGMPIFTIVALDPMDVRVGVPEAEIGRIRVGQRAQVRVPALPAERFEGRVRLIGVAADPTSRTYSVKLSVANARRLLRPGMIAEARISQDTRVDALTLPASAVVRDADGATQVFVYNAAERRVYARRVTVGTVHGQEVEVTSGLSATDVIVVGGQHRVREGAKVEATTVEATTVEADGEAVAAHTASAP